MLKLSASDHERARAYINVHGRPVERALYAYHLQDGGAEAVHSALRAYQNSDGGFGHGLEPDLALPDSSVLATTVALQRLRGMGTDSAHPLVRGAMSFLIGSYNREHLSWANVPPNVDDAPHAPWWGYDDGDAWWAGSWANPRAEIVGYLYEHVELAPEDLLSSLSTVVLEALAKGADGIEMHDLLCYMRLATTPTLPEGMRTELLTHMRLAAERLVARDLRSWSSYGLQPLQLCPTPDAPFADLFAAEIEANLEYEIAQQEDDGSWATNWTWGDAHPEAWAAACQAWKSVLTLDTILHLRAFGRLES